MVFKLLFAEILYRRGNFLLSLCAVTVAVALFVAGPLLIDGYGQQTRQMIADLHKQMDAELSKLEDETRRIMRDLGFNLLIVHKDTNMSDFWANDFADKDMPEQYVDRLAKDPRLTLVRHLVATLKQKITWQNRKVLLVGYREEVPQPHLSPKKPMGPVIEPGTVHLGYELGQGLKVGDTIEVLGEKFRVAKILEESGSIDDITIKMNLRDAQRITGKQGRINEILALGCLCPGPSLPQIRAQLEQVLPETKVTEFKTKALARAEQRRLVAQKHKELIQQVAQSRSQVQHTLEMLAAVLIPIVLVASAIWVGSLAMANVRERRAEIALLRALGKGAGTVAVLFLAKAVLLGILGGILGYVLGTVAGWWFGKTALGVPQEFLALRIDLLVAALLGAPLLAAAASYLPTVAAMAQDPAVVLQDR